MVIIPFAIICLHHVTKFENNNNLKLGLVRRQSVCRLFFTPYNRLGSWMRDFGFEIRIS